MLKEKFKNRKANEFWGSEDDKIVLKKFNNSFLSNTSKTMNDLTQLLNSFTEELKEIKGCPITIEFYSGKYISVKGSAKGINSKTAILYKNLFSGKKFDSALKVSNITFDDCHLNEYIEEVNFDDNTFVLVDICTNSRIHNFYWFTGKRTY